MVIVARELDTIIVWEKLAKNAFYRNEKLIDSKTNPIDSVSSLGEQLQIYNIYQPWTCIKSKGEFTLRAIVIPLWYEVIIKFHIMQKLKPYWRF